MTTTTQQTQRETDGRFASLITLHDSELPPAVQAITATPAVTLQHFNSFQQTVSPSVLIQHRNDLVRIFISSLRTNEWSLQDSLKAAPVVDWLLGLKTKRGASSYTQLSRPLVEWAKLKLHVPLAQKRTWTKMVAHKPTSCPKDIGGQPMNAIPFPAVLTTHSRSIKGTDYDS